MTYGQSGAETEIGTDEVTEYSTPIRSGTRFVSPARATTAGEPRRESRSALNQTGAGPSSATTSTK